MVSNDFQEEIGIEFLPMASRSFDFVWVRAATGEKRVIPFDGKGFQGRMIAEGKIED